jgi:hypothetical protein
MLRISTILAAALVAASPVAASAQTGGNPPGRSETGVDKVGPHPDRQLGDVLFGNGVATVGPSLRAPMVPPVKIG